MMNFPAWAAQAWRRSPPALFGFAASTGLTDATIPLRKFPDNRFNAIIGGLAVLIVVVGFTARALSRRFAHRPRPAPRPRLEPTLLPQEVPASAPPDTGAWSLALLNALESRRFEAVCTACFESLGYGVRAAPHGAERRVDLRLHRGGAEPPCILVRCKAARGASARAEEVRELLEALEAERAPEGIFVTSGAFAAEARALAGSASVHLIDGQDLLWKIGHLSESRQRSLLEQATAGDYATPTCRICGARAWRCAHPPQGEAPRDAWRFDPAEADYWSRVMLP